MKKLFLTTVCIFCVGLLFGQTLSKGSVFAVHIAKVDLKPGVTMQQLEDFVINKYVPAYNKAFEGITAFPVKGLRGENENTLAVLFYMESDEIRTKYFPKEGEPSELAEASFAKLQKVQEEYSKLATQTDDLYTDWIVK